MVFLVRSSFSSLPQMKPRPKSRVLQHYELCNNVKKLLMTRYRKLREDRNKQIVQLISLESSKIEGEPLICPAQLLIEHTKFVVCRLQWFIFANTLARPQQQQMWRV